MSTRRIVTGLGLPVVLGLERAAYYGMRAILVMYVTRDLAMPAASLGALFGVFGILVTLAPIGGAVLGLLASRRH